MQSTHRSPAQHRIGILMLVFGAIALSYKLYTISRGSGDLLATASPPWAIGLRVVGLIVGAAHVAGGMALVRGTSRPRVWAMVYAIPAIASTAAIWLVAMTFPPGAGSSGCSGDFPVACHLAHGVGSFFGSFVVWAGSIGSVAWPIVVLCLLGKLPRGSRVAHDDREASPLPRARARFRAERIQLFSTRLSAYAVATA